MTMITVPAVRAVLEAAGLPEATIGPAGRLASAGYLVIPLRVLGPERAAVCWCAPGPTPGSPMAPGDGLASCQDALHDAGCYSESLLTAGGGYLAVLPPKARHKAPHPAHAVSVPINDLALILRHVRATRLGGPHAQPAAQTSGDTTAAYHRLKAAIVRHASAGGQP